MSGTAPSVSVVVADDHPLYREGLVAAIERQPELELVAQCADGRSALAAIREHRPSVALLDVRMPGLGGTEVLDAVERDGLPTRVLLLSAYVDGPVVYAAIAAGAAGYITKEAGRQEVCDAIAEVAQGRVLLCPEVHTGLAHELRARRADADSVLTPREREILVLTAQGHLAPEIGRRLFVSSATVKTHLQHLYEKLRVGDRAAAVAEGMRRGLLE